LERRRQVAESARGGRRSAAHPALPVVLVTGYGNRALLRDFGEARILQKPFAEDELVERIARALH
jgi:FixJ family two-component response regulator